MIKPLAIPLLLLVNISLLFSQGVDSTKKVIVLLNDDTEIIGYIVNKDSSNTTIKSITGILSIVPNSQILEVKRFKGKLIGKEHYKRDPADNRLMAFPTGRALNTGEFQFNAMELVFPHLLFGITDFINIGFGGIPFIASGGGTFIYYATSKITPVNLEYAAVSFGGAIVGATASNGIVGVAYAMGTFGTYLDCITVGSFLAFSGDEVFNRPAVLAGGQTRISNSATLLSENIILFGNDTEEFIIFPSLGIRFSGGKIAADFGTYAVITKDNFFYPIPWIGFTYKF